MRDPVCLREMLGFTSSLLARSWGAPASVGRGSPVTQCFLVPAEAIVRNSAWDRTADVGPQHAHLRNRKLLDCGAHICGFVTGCHSTHCRAREGQGAPAGGPLTGRCVPASGGTCRPGGPCSEAGPPAALCRLCGGEFYRRLRTLDPKRISSLSLPGMNGPFITECPFGSCAAGQTRMEGPL